jgi:hypothetical protein
MVGDVNGDGMVDLIGFGTSGVFVALSTGTGFGAVSQWSNLFAYNDGWRVDMHPRMVGDVNGDGMVDLIGFGTSGVFVALSTGTGFGAVSQWSNLFAYNDGWRVDMHPRMVGDVNGDGKVDLIGFGTSGVFVALSTGTGFGAVSQWSNLFAYNDGWRVDMHPRMVGDVNGDGKVDLIGFGTSGVFVALSTGTGFGAVSQWSNLFAYNDTWRVDMHPRMVGDVNGDGKVDLLGFGYSGVFVALSTGTGFGAVSQWSNLFAYNDTWRVDMHPRMVGDVTGDGMADLIGFGYSGVFVAPAQ